MLYRIIATINSIHDFCISLDTPQNHRRLEMVIGWLEIAIAFALVTLTFVAVTTAHYTWIAASWAVENVPHYIQQLQDYLALYNPTEALDIIRYLRDAIS